MFNLNTCTANYQHQKIPVMFNPMKFKTQKCRIKAFQVRNTFSLILFPVCSMTRIDGCIN